MLTAPGLAAEVPPDERPDVVAFFNEAKALAAEVVSLEADDADDEAAVASVEAAAANLERVLQPIKAEVERSGLMASFKRHETLRKRIAELSGTAGLAGEPSAVMVPYIDAASTPPRWMAQGYGPLQGDLDTRWDLYHRPGGTFVAATPANTMDRAEANWRPVWTDRFVYFGPLNSGPRWGVKDNWVTSHEAMKANLVRAGQMQTVGRILKREGDLTPAERQALAAIPLPRGQSSLTWPAEPKPPRLGAPRCGTTDVAFNTLNSNRQMVPVLKIAETWAEPTPDADFHTRKWYADGCPRVTVGYHANQSWFTAALASASKAMSDTFKNQWVAAALMTLTGGPLGLAISVRRLVRGEGDELSRDLARMFAAGMVAPGYGPVMAVVAPDEANRILQRLAANVFFMEPAFASLVAHAEGNRAKRKSFRDKIQKRRIKFLVKYKPLIDITLAVIEAIGAVLAVFTFGLSAAAITTGVTIVRLVMFATELQVMGKALSDAAKDAKAFNELVRQRKAELDAEILILEAEAMQLEEARALQRVAGPSKTALAVALAAGLALAYAVGG
ncbi:MAG: hypothetical protein Q8Q14_11125 [Gemmatimonadales bacterium]|nr:hypothetical protein [Gemmatimonadales bacterium]